MNYNRLISDIISRGHDEDVRLFMLSPKTRAFIESLAGDWNNQYIMAALGIKDTEMDVLQHLFENGSDTAFGIFSELGDVGRGVESLKRKGLVVEM